MPQWWEGRFKPDDVYSRQDVFGYCSSCRREGNAVKTTFYNGEILYTCGQNSKHKNTFAETGDTYNNPHNHRPGRGTNDGNSYDDGSGRYTKGQR